MNQVPLNERNSTEFDSLLAESINNNKLKEGTIIKGIIDEIQDKWFCFRMPIPSEGHLPEGAL